MTRIGLVIAGLVCALTACAPSPGDRDGGPEGGEAQTAKEQMDSLAGKVLPDLVPVLGKDLADMQADFVERGGWGLWDYRARARVVSPRPAEKSLPAVKRVLQQHGLALETTDRPSEVSATTGNVRVSVSWTAGDEVDVADLSLHTLEPASGDDDYADGMTPEDYSAYWR